MWEKGDNMKKNKKLVIIAVLMALLTGMPSLVQAANNEPEQQTSFEYEDGYESGYHAGWKEGYTDGDSAGYEKGYEDGYVDGCESGYNAGVESTIEYMAEIYEWDDGQKESAYADNYWRRTIDEEGGNVDSDYVEFYWEELPEYPATAQ